MAESNLLTQLSQLLGDITPSRSFPKPSTRPPKFNFSFDNVPLDSALYVVEGATISFVVQSILVGDTVTCSYRIITADGEVKGFVGRLTTTGAYTQDFLTQTLPECYLLNASLSSFSATSRGQTWASVRVSGGYATNNNEVWNVTQGYVRTSVPLSFPPSQREDPTDGNGYLRRVVGTAPAGGAECLELTTGLSSNVLTGFFVVLTTDATVANRNVSLMFGGLGSSVYRFRAPTNQTASQVITYRFEPYAGRSGLIGTDMFVGLPHGLRVDPASQIQTLTSGLQAGDQFSVPQYLLDTLVF